ncbi:DUF393 domain-containing protein [Alcanivorax sp. S6407]|uniref:thiol-disulfide oxidoreductase DCC family protein n=1 Tax=Alcanivorax sp. S6407 TaxID=2926424 RepID=UPI001FF362F0|nr:DCC1-like thiol-disulfide oxidoreductase family protein [Alcanivorax sp. S6407]MCK0154356.1 DUF393 domain-containing protein [Alcanivorax sp. S6407]
MNVDPADTYLIYDGDCPACRNYVRFVRFRDAVNQLHLINAREAPQWVTHLQDNAMPLDEGMVLVFHGRYYHGADAIHHMALLGSSKGLFNRINGWLFRSARVSAVLYPVLKSLRNALLWLLRKKPIATARHAERD